MVAFIAGLNGVEEDVADGLSRAHDADDIVDAHHTNACAVVKFNADEALGFLNDELTTSAVIEVDADAAPARVNRIDDAEWRVLPA
jgi:hypothetical protein